jgi:glutathione S-transferase
MKLYYSPGACSLAPHIALREAGIDVTLEKVDLREKKTEAGADFIAINPKGYVPVLELADGALLTEGMVIQQYIADRSPSARLAPPAGSMERVRVEELLVFIATELHKSFNPLFVETTPQETKATLRTKIERHLDVIEALLSDGRLYLSGDGFTVADIYLFVIAGWSRPTGIDLSRWPKLSAFMERVAAREAVQAALRAEGLTKAA